MASKQQSVGGTRNLQLTRAHKILALVPAQNACSDDSSTSDEEANAYIPPSPDTSDPPSIASSLNYQWLKAVFRHNVSLEENLYNLHQTQIETVLDYFYFFFSPDLITDIVYNTNLYAVEQLGRSIQLTEDEIKSFLAIQIMMGIVQMPAYTDYWARKTRYPLIADLMPLKKYQQIRRYIHFVDNTLQDSDRYFKIRPLMEKIRKNFLKIEEGKYSIDEMMIPYKGRKAGKRKQYIKMKPKKWGFKNFVRAGVSGIIYDFILYGGDDTFRGLTFSEKEATIGLGGMVVLALCQTIKKKPAIVYADNFFMSPELTYILREEYGILSLGTIRTNRLRGCQELLPTDKQLKKKKRGSSAQVVCNKNKLAVVKWNDNKVVTLISTYIDSYPLETIKRYDKDEKKKVDVECPQVVKHYNKHMGGVDLADMLISLYRTPFKSHRWYLGIFSQLVDMCINNAWLLHRRDGKKTSLKDFRFELFDGLSKSNRIGTNQNVTDDIGENLKIHKPVSVRPTDSVRFDNTGDLPEAGNETMRCKYCKSGRTSVYCIKCNVHLCFVVGKIKRNCFRNFHLK
ncbi:piggyBac transposable element-derived protein 2-like [Danaus plexippus]|uniref:piggyBac transposable element-derived protein 2-like n=1 Tax=Danaus plexippus TaxID=13037 RepID=UPI002AB3270D|nr:piggyBac transposable element-derived protein 2-like [Danaus plexippus]